jgi:hypothetical protein
MSDDTVPGPSPISRGPVPALGYILAAPWLVVTSLWVLLPIPGTGLKAQEPIWIAATVVGALVAVAPPLLLKKIPGRLRRQALPFLILAGVLAVGSVITALASFYQLVMVDALVLYVLGWMRLRGRSPLAPLVSLATPVLWVVGQQVAVALVTGLNGPVAGQGAPGPEAAWRAVQNTLMMVIPVCVPLLVTSLPRFRARAADPVEQDASSERTRADWNPTAVAALVLGVVGGGLIAVVFGHLARSQNRRTKQRGSGLAAAGLVLGYLGTIIVAGLWMVADLIANA